MDFHAISEAGKLLEVVSDLWLGLAALLVLVGLVVGLIRYFEKPRLTLEEIHETFQDNRQQVMRLVPGGRTRRPNAITGEHSLSGRSGTS